MYYEAHALLFMFLGSPLHAGTESGSAAADLPIQEEVHTRYPIVQSSGIKGALKAAFLLRSNLPDADVMAIFGPDRPDATSSIAVTDAQVLLFPVKAAENVFVWVTSPHVLGRFARLLRIAGGAPQLLQCLDTLALIPLGERAGLEEALWTRGATAEGQERLILDERILCAYQPAPVQDEVPDVGILHLDHLQNLMAALANSATSSTYFQQELTRRTAIVPDVVFRDLVVAQRQIETHVSIGATGTVSEGPWDEELIPAESLLYSFLTFRKIEKKIEAGEAFTKVQQVIPARLPWLQVGGDATLGHGLVELGFNPLTTVAQPTVDEEEAAHAD